MAGSPNEVSTSNRQGPLRDLYAGLDRPVKSQAHAGWTLVRSRYDDGGYSGGSTDRPNLQQLLEDVRCRKVDVILVYKVDRLTRSLADFKTDRAVRCP
jgi:DNA invertase Pin-like site-specific DNA recombinase